VPTQKKHWLRLLERNFAREDGLPVLERVCRETAARIGPPLRRRQVVLTLPVPIPGQTNWGGLNGRALDFRKPVDCLAACEWYLDVALAKWHALAPRELELTGFYWVYESSAFTNEFLPQVAHLVHARGKQFCWIPYWHAGGAQANWRAFGFDVAWQEPNHFFHPELPDSRLQAACDFARRHGMGLEMEFDGRLLSQPESFEPRFNAYLDAFTRNGVKETAAVAYYEGGVAVFQLATSEDPELRRHYDRLAEFVLHRQRLADEASRRVR